MTMVKITRFEDVPQFTRSGSWECDYTLPRVLRFVEQAQEEEGLNLDPDFQRAHVWTEKQQIAWLEFFLRGGKTGRVLYFNNPNWIGTKVRGKYEFVIVDGKQRLQAITRFLKDEIRIFGSLYSEYTDKPQPTMKINVNDLKTRAEVLQWYIEFNSGGVVHSEEEIERVRKLLEKEQGK